MVSTTERQEARPSAPYVVGIGASAGGLDALERFFTSVPQRSGMAFVVVQHLSPDFKSLMDELLARRTQLPVHLAEDGIPVEPDHVYLLPPGKAMSIEGGRLRLSDRDKKHELALPIDVFFKSLARDCGERAISVVLSGGGSDGSRGIRDVHRAGGLVAVQDPTTAQFDGMPRAALDTELASFVLAPEDLPGALVEHVRSPHETRRAAGAPPADGFEAVYAMLEREFGIDFTHYKPSTVTRRIERRLQLARIGEIGAYVDRLRKERAELDTLYRDLLIGVTRFFRNDEAFDLLATEVLPEMLARGPRDLPFRVWVPGCATGEEAYSLAILLSELTAGTGGRPFKIFATDVHAGSIEAASRAVYSEEAVANVSRERLDRWFQHRGGAYQVAPDLRQNVVFAVHNVIRDAPFTRVDLISCRNMLIYLQPAVQEKVLGLFHFALGRGGVLFLGPSESPGVLTDELEPIDRHWRIYRKRGDARLASDTRFRGPSVEARRSPSFGTTPARHSLAQLLSTYDVLLDERMPPSLLVDESGELLHSFAGASRYLRLKDGRQDLEVLDIIDGELRMVVVGGLQRAKREASPVMFRGVRIPIDGVPVVHDVSVRRVRDRHGGGRHVLITITPSEADASTGAQRVDGTEVELDQVSRERMADLERELSYTKENLQAAIEELETGNEELQATNEELIASNEELQSTNEELQSVNEELYTVNAEYQRKIQELTELTNDVDNLLSSTDVGAVFLDRELRIRKFTPQIAESFTLLPRDVGRSIETFTHRLDYPELNEAIRRVLATGTPIERQVGTKGGRTYFLRVLPYRANGSIEGVVVTIIDISSLKAAEDALFQARHLLDSLLASTPDAIYFKSDAGRFIRVNAPMAARLGLDHGAGALDQADLEVLRTGVAQEYRLERRAPDGEGVEGWDLATRLPLRDREGHVVGVIGVLRDVTEQKHAEERIHDAVRRRDEFLAMLSHELRNPLGALVNATAILTSGKDAAERRPHLLRLVERQSRQMARLLDDLLEVGRVTQSKIELRRRIVDVRELVHDAADAVRGAMESRRHELVVSVPDEPLYVDGDPARLHQIQVNLLHNAAKYTPPGGHVRLEARAEDGCVVLRVRDDGMGIPRHMIEHVFDLFVQSERTLERADGGLGVGLTLVRSLVTMHGGSVEAHSDGEGRGAEIVIRLPRAEAPGRSDPDRARGPRTGASVRGMSVVIVEDNAESRETLCALLEAESVTCRTAAHGEEGFALVREVAPDVAILDVGLPGIDGFELARRLRADPSLASVRLVALTGYGQESDRSRAREVGFDAHLVKPVEPAHLLEVMAELRPRG
ncbi:chemotaxis protein CheB [Sandaracinus amylolyticus]|uniref:chemotaxis protein CheB n=1 Tax=Sandaracinus amylolyticus TaxID=927083 RepID=UPI001F40A829|nr:chemotaxis protein CheB [Sandaracinus amylolyticus]UJR85249.1 Hypothetical protein I5071_73290 [Sandaracinus amylolyticus]